MVKRENQQTLNGEYNVDYWCSVLVTMLWKNATKCGRYSVIDLVCQVISESLVAMFHNINHYIKMGISWKVAYNPSVPA